MVSNAMTLLADIRYSPRS